MVLDNEEDVFRVSVESCVGEGEGESAVGDFVGAGPGPDVGVVQVCAPSAVYQLETNRLNIRGSHT